MHCSESGGAPPLLAAHTIGMDYLAGLGRTSPDTTLVGFARTHADPAVTAGCAPIALGTGSGTMRVVQMEVHDADNMRADGKEGQRRNGTAQAKRSSARRAVAHYSLRAEPSVLRRKDALCYSRAV